MTETSDKSDIKSEIKSLILVVILAMMIRTFVIEIFFVPTSSMQATILEREYIFSTKYSYGFSKYSLPFSPDLFSGRFFASAPERGDVIIMRPPHDMQNRYIKRLIGLPGDTIRIINDVIYINKQPVKRQKVGKFTDESGREYDKFKETLPNGVSYFTYKAKDLILFADDDHKNYGPYTVPEGKYFFLGDNRDHSGDSRYQLGYVPFENFIAKAQFVLFSTKEMLWVSNISFTEQITRVWTWLTSIRFNRIFSTALYNAEPENQQ